MCVAISHDSLCLLLGNRAAGDGGALLVYRCEPTQCETEANTYRGNKARVRCAIFAQARIASSLISFAWLLLGVQHGGAIAVFAQAPSIDGSKFTQNK